MRNIILVLVLILSLTLYPTAQISPVLSGVTVPTGNSGGVPYYNASSTLASSPTWTLNTLLTGGGAGSSPIVTGATIDGSGNLLTTGNVTSGNSLLSSNNVVSSPAGFVGWSSRSAMLSPSDGIIQLTNLAQTAFTRLQFGGTTASFPAIRRTTTALNFRLADDSADAGITALTAALSGKITLYNNLATVGIGTVPIFGAVHSITQIAAITPNQTLCAAAVCTGGMYVIDAILLSTVTCATPGPAVVAVNLTWTDEAGTKTAQVLPLDDNNATTFSASLPLGTTTGYAFGSMVIRSTGVNPIQYATTYTACTSGTGTYNIDLTVEQKQ